MIRGIVLLISTTALLMAYDTYFGLAGSVSQFTQQEDNIVDCRLGTNAILGARSKNLAIETRYNYGMSEDFSSLDVYGKGYFGFIYGIIGYGKTFYDNIDDVSGVRYGVGAEYKKDEDVILFIDAISKPEEDDYKITVGFTYNFGE